MDIKICYTCNGKGYTTVEKGHPSNPRFEKKSCPMCNSTGKIKEIKLILTAQIPYSEDENKLSKWNSELFNSSLKLKSDLKLD